VEKPVTREVEGIDFDLDGLIDADEADVAGRHLASISRWGRLAGMTTQRMQSCWTAQLGAPFRLDEILAGRRPCAALPPTRLTSSASVWARCSTMAASAASAS